MKDCPKPISGSSLAARFCGGRAELLRRYLEQDGHPLLQALRGVCERSRRIRHVEDLRHLPFTTKRDVQDHPLDFILVPDKKILARRPSTILRALCRGRQAVEESFEREFRPSFMTFTTGRSSQPLPFLYTDHDLRRLQDRGGPHHAHLRREAGHADAQHVSLRAASRLLAIPLRGHGIRRVDGEQRRRKSRGHRGQSARSCRSSTPDVLIGMPTFIYHVLQRGGEPQHPAARKSRKLILGGEKAPPACGAN